MNFKAICSRCFSLICLLGFVLQLQQISELYFRYQTTSKSEFEIPEEDEYQTLIFCPRFAEVLDRTNHFDLGIRPTPPSSLQDLEEDFKRLTIKNILELTPSEFNVVSDCLRREGNMSTLLQMTKAECEHFFNISKSVNGGRICYTFMPRNRTFYSIGDVASSQEQTNTVYQINFLPSLGKAIVGFFISGYMCPGKEKDALDSRIYQAKVLNTGNFNQSNFAVYGESIEISRLPPPYDTRCTPGHDREDCYENCLNNKFQAINRIPWSGFHKTKMDMKMITSADLKNKSISLFASRSFQTCHELCKRKTECHTTYSKTTVQEYVDKSFAYNLAIEVMVPAGPNMSVYSLPFLNPIEFLIQIGSCVGVWFGLSIISFNPIKWKMLTKVSRRRTNRCRRLLIPSRIPRLR